jgi:6-pyruvoyltetrahydropterin/6-carboxytetrahydropterin synthase
MNIRVTKEFHFEAAHALDGYDGKCRDIHGHSYHLKVTFLGKPIESKDISECGMVVDFGDIKRVVKEKVFDLFDHCLILRNDSRFKPIELKNSRVRYVDYQPTCENMLLEIVLILQDQFENITLHNVFLRETANSYAEWCAADND